MPTRLLAIFLSLLLIIPQAGCLTRPPSLSLHDELLNQRIALVAAQSEVDINLELFAKSRPQGALSGAGHGIAAMLQGLGGGSCSGEFCGAALLLYLAFAVVVGGTVGAIQGSLEATPAETSAAIEIFARQQLREFVSHLSLAGKILAKNQEVAGLEIDQVPQDVGATIVTGEALHRLAAAGYQKALVVKVTRCDFVGDQGQDPQFGLYLEALVRIMDTGSDAEVYQREFGVIGTVRRHSEWLRLPPEALAGEFNANLETLAGQIVDGLFVAYTLPVASGSWAFPGTADYGCCWICPIAPPLQLDFFPTMQQEWPTVSSRQPQLAWQAFPGAARHDQIKSATGHAATNVRYDLRIWEARGAQLGPLAYERYALPDAVHQVESPLKPRSAYLWSIRACFDLDERAACTPWAFSLIPAGRDACESTTVGAESYYRFRVP